MIDILYNAEYPVWQEFDHNQISGTLTKLSILLSGV